MSKTQLTANLQKHISKNPLQKLLINNFYKTMTKLIKPLRIETILDVGCGEGFSLQKLSELNMAEKLEGIDYSEEAIRVGKNLFPHLSLKQGNIYHLPYKNNSFDLVISTEVLEHLDKPLQGLNEILRVSKKNIILSVPNEPFFRLANFVRGKNLTRFGNDSGHINYWNFFSFPNFLKKNALKIKKIKFPFPWILVLGEKIQ